MPPLNWCGYDSTLLRVGDADLEQHVQHPRRCFIPVLRLLLSSRLPASAAPDTSHVEVLMHQYMANRLGVQADEEYVLFRAANPNPAIGERAFALPVRIAGIWRAADRAQTGSVVAALDEASVEILDLADAKGQLETWRTDPVRLGLNGFLSLGLGVGLVLGVLALVVHGILALQRRRIQIGILRAIGWSRGQGVLCIALEPLAIATLGMGGNARRSRKPSVRPLPSDRPCCRVDHPALCRPHFVGRIRYRRCHPAGCGLYPDRCGQCHPCPHQAVSGAQGKGTRGLIVSGFLSMPLRAGSQESANGHSL